MVQTPPSMETLMDLDASSHSHTMDTSIQIVLMTMLIHFGVIQKQGMHHLVVHGDTVHIVTKVVPFHVFYSCDIDPPA